MATLETEETKGNKVSLETLESLANEEKWELRIFFLTINKTKTIICR